MSTQSSDRPATRPLERLGFTALVLLTLAPVALQGLWRPIAHASQVETDSLRLAIAALVVAIAALLACATRSANRRLSIACAALAALLFGPLLGRGLPAIVAISAALLGVAILCGALAPWLVRRLPAQLDGLAARRKGVTALMLVLGVLTVTMTTRLGVYMGDKTRPELSLAPDVPFMVHHSCLSAYVEGTRLAGAGVDNLYADEHWPHLGGSPGAAASGAPYAPFVLDTYAYPPPFMLLPRVVLTPLGEFASQRAVWFTINGLLIAAGLWIVATWIGGRARVRALLLAPLLWISAPLAFTLQIGNVHALVVVAVMLALVAFETRRPALGGALLAFAVVAKISPGLLVLVLLLQRRFREVLWTAAWGLALALAGLAVFGLAPYEAFLTHELPRLSSGEALSFLALPESVPINAAPFGIPFKLATIGVDVGDPWKIGKIINQVFTVALLVVTVLAARRGGGRRAQAEVWAALMTLASLRSPFAPGYVLFSLLWLLSLRAVEVRGAVQTGVAVVVWIAMSNPLPGGGAPTLIASLFQQALMFGVLAHALLRKPPGDDPPCPEGQPA